jgi:hypothetical protein
MPACILGANFFFMVLGLQFVTLRDDGGLRVIDVVIDAIMRLA